MGFTLLIVIIILALVFDYINGFHDAANSIATVVSTKVLTPFQAVLWAAFFNFLAYWIFHLNVADTVAKTADTMNINLLVILAGVLAAICWNLLTWWFGIPSSSSHTLIGGFAGAAVAHGGLNVVNLSVIGKVASFIVLAPIIGMIMAYFITVIIINICRYANPSKAEWWFKKLQLLSSALFSLGHGGNDAQKVMGIIAAAIIVYLKDANLSVDTMSAWLHVDYTVLNGKVKINHIGTRHGEKLYESLLGSEEGSRAIDRGDYYQVPLDARSLDYQIYFEKGQSDVSEEAAYTSHNTNQLTVDQVAELISHLPEYIQYKETHSL